MGKNQKKNCQELGSWWPERVKDRTRAGPWKLIITWWSGKTTHSRKIILGNLLGVTYCKMTILTVYRKTGGPGPYRKQVRIRYITESSSSLISGNYKVHSFYHSSHKILNSSPKGETVRCWPGRFRTVSRSWGDESLSRSRLTWRATQCMWDA
jgi:hypothetical protein